MSQITVKKGISKINGEIRSFFDNMLVLSILLMKKLTQILCFCSGVYTPLLKKAPTEINKYTGIGGTVIFTGIMASLSAGYALYTIFQSLIPALFFGILWGLMIFNLDRYIVSSMRKNHRIWNEWKMALPRLVFAGLIAVVISKPLELKIFEREINRKLDEKKISLMQETKETITIQFAEIDILESQKDSLKREIDAASTYRNDLQEAYDKERFGEKTGYTSGIIGLGSNAKKREQQLDAAQQQLDEIRSAHQLRVDRLDISIADLMAKRDEAIEKAEPAIANYDGIAARLEALSLLTSESIAIKTASLFFVLLFMAVETAPIFVKLLSQRGPYDDLLDLAESSVSVYAHEKNTILKAKSKSKLRVFETQLTANDAALG